MRPPAQSKAHRFLWITDPWLTLDHPNDTSLRLAEEALVQGHASYWCDFKTIRFEKGKACMTAFPLLKCGAARQAKDFVFGKAETYVPDEFDSLHYRTDPPVDQAYFGPLQILKLGMSGKRAQMVNPLSVLLHSNEKLESQLIPSVAPEMVVSSQKEVLERFGIQKKKTILKPLHDAQSRGVHLLSWGTSQERTASLHLLSKATQKFTTPVILQRYFKGILQGEKRLWFIDGKLLGAVKKHPLPSDYRVDIDRGSSVTATQLTTREKSLALQIGKHLRKQQIRLAAIDLIDGKVTDLNFTSPGLIVQMEKVLKRNLASILISSLSGKSF